MYEVVIKKKIVKSVACWVETEQGIQVEVTYVGSRESAPYAKH